MTSGLARTGRALRRIEELTATSRPTQRQRTQCCIIPDNSRLTRKPATEALDKISGHTSTPDLNLVFSLARLSESLYTGLPRFAPSYSPFLSPIPPPHDRSPSPTRHQDALSIPAPLGADDRIAPARLDAREWLHTAIHAAKVPVFEVVVVAACDKPCPRGVDGERRDCL